MKCFYFQVYKVLLRCIFADAKPLFCFVLSICMPTNILLT
jgi:hypothetical protein